MLNNPLLITSKQERTASTINKVSQIVSEIRDLNPNLEEFEIWDIVLIAVDSMKRDLQGVELQ